MSKQMGLKRRGFVGIMGLGATSAMVGGCATTGGAGGNMGKVVVVGGGYGGATAAKYLRMWSEGQIEVTLIEPNKRFVSCPISNLVVGGIKQIGDITVPYDNLARRHGVKLVQDTVASIDPAKKTVRLASGDTLPYDRLVLSPGVDFMWDSVRDLRPA